MPSEMSSVSEDLKSGALVYHRLPRPGKLEIQPTKPLGNQRDLALAYTPGVAAVCEAIAADPAQAAELTTRQNLVAVVSNGTAVLGLGNIGPLASKPVMEGKAVLFKKFAGIDVFDIEIAAWEVDHVVEVVAALEPTFGGINLEDFKAPECFEIEAKLKERMNIPVFHDDQHGTAIIVAAAVRNALSLAGKDIAAVKIVTSGAGAAALACLNLLVELGARRENIWVTDLEGCVYQGRPKLMDRWKTVYAQATDKRTLGEVIDGADIFLGLSAGGVLKPDMVKRMAERPLIMALANPNPGDHAGGGGRGAAGRHDLHRPLGFSQPGQQRPVLPAHLPRRARRRRHHHQRGDEAGRGRGDRGARARGALGRRGARLWRRSAATSGPARSSPIRSTRG